MASWATSADGRDGVRRRAAVLGAGASGLVALKECLAAGMDVVCFDQEPQVGGLWRYVPAKPDSEESHSSVYESTVINTSKDMLAFSDFPVPEDWPTFMPHRYVVRYLQLYANQFGLKKHIKFNRRVLRVEPELDDQTHEHTGRWEVTTQRCRRKGPVRTVLSESPKVNGEMASLHTSGTKARGGQQQGQDHQPDRSSNSSLENSQNSSIFLSLRDLYQNGHDQPRQPAGADSSLPSSVTDIGGRAPIEDVRGRGTVGRSARIDARSLSPVQLYDPSQGYEPAPVSSTDTPSSEPSNSNMASTDAQRTGSRSSGDQRSNNGTTSRPKKEIFDFVMVCTGHHWKPRLPEFEGVKHFTGNMLHSHMYRVPYPFKDQRVLVVGTGNSGMDIATEVSHHASQVLLSTRTGTWVLPRSTLFGVPIDHLSSRAFSAVPRSLANFALESLLRLHHGDLRRYGLQPNHHFMEAHPTINSEILGRIDAGKIVVRSNVTKFHQHNVVEFSDGKRERVDAVIYCTGYRVDHPFLDAQTILGQDDADSNRVRLYKHVFPTHYRNIAFIGMVQPTGSVLPVSEMQSRWAVRVFTEAPGTPPLPSPTTMRDTIDIDWVTHCKSYLPRDRHALQIDYVPYMDDLAQLVGCLPDLWRLWRTNWSLAAQVCFGPALPFHYRLEGPGSWCHGAEAAIRHICCVYDPLKRLQNEIDANQGDCRDHPHQSKHLGRVGVAS